MQRTSQQSFVPSDNEKKLALLLQLGSHFWTPDHTRAQAKHLLADYLVDLERFTSQEVDNACISWRRTVENKKFPRTAELVQWIVEDKRHRAEMASDRSNSKCLETQDSRPILWWHLPKTLWKTHWRENEAPVGELIRDAPGMPLREAM